MAYANMNLSQVLTQCHYDQGTKNYLYQEQMHLQQMYQLSYKATNVKLSTGAFVILEVNGTIPVLFNNNTYNIPIKIHYLQGYPKTAPVLIVNPSADMVIKASEYVSDQGIANLEIIRQWNPRLTTVMVLEEAKKAFSFKMPVFKKPRTLTEKPQTASYQSLPPNNADLRFSGPNPVYTTLDPYSLQRAPTDVYDSRYTSVNPVVAQPVPASKPILTPQTVQKIKEIHSDRLKELKNEIGVLENENRIIKGNKEKIEFAVEGFRTEVLNGQGKKELIEASIRNTEDWIAKYSNSTVLDVGEEELVEYRSEEVKTYLGMASREKALESTIGGVVDAINKAVVPAKEGLMCLKQLYADLFLMARLKEKAEKLLSNQN